ncbi:hypothetical protein [Nostoc sp. FACHB-888]|uniref:hypothetical protein n=1 Tax=Nostoc sp. FACHB-888 TaxID=2692842 RepID=UPI0016871B90|nr:hypothetical protein [Nostoc sp. FACHB-888]MBD2246708.1 hypothetical protein [Nostoc sp. FACHB-888]
MFVESTIVKSQERHALVIGGSIAGLLSDRDLFPINHAIHSLHCWHLSPVEQICHLQILKLQHHAAALTTLAQRNNCIAHLFF